MLLLLLLLDWIGGESHEKGASELWDDGGDDNGREGSIPEADSFGKAIKGKEMNSASQTGRQAKQADRRRYREKRREKA